MSCSVSSSQTRTCIVLPSRVHWKMSSMSEQSRSHRRSTRHRPVSTLMPINRGDCVSARSCGPHSNRDDEIAAGSRQTTELQLTWLDEGRSEAAGRVEGAAEAGKLGRNRGCHVRGRGLRFALDLLTNKGKKSAGSSATGAGARQLRPRLRPKGAKDACKRRSLG